MCKLCVTLTDCIGPCSSKGCCSTVGRSALAHAFHGFVFSSSYLKGPFQGEFVKCNGPQGHAEDLVLPFEVETRSRLLIRILRLHEDIEIA